MSNKTYNHGVCKGAIALGTGCMRCERCAEQLAARVQELEAEIAAVGAGGVQALSAGPAEVPTADVQAKIASNTWNHFGDILPTLKAISRGDWYWGANSRCKYIEIRIDTRDGGCILYDRERVRISPEQLAHQSHPVGKMEPWPAANLLAASPTPPAEQPADPDGEAFRTAARLGLTLRFYGACAQSSMPGTPSAYVVTQGSNPAEAMRDAVEQAAAIIASGGEAPKATLAPPAEQPEDEGISREQWIDQAVRVYLIAGDTEDQALECAAYLWGELDMDDLADPYDAAMSDIEERGPAPEQQATTTGAALGVEPGAVYAELPDLDDTLWLAIGQHRRAITTIEISAAAKAVDASVFALMRDFADRTHALRMQAAPKAAPSMPEGWTACTIEFNDDGPEEVAYGPKIMMDRLAKWLGNHFERTITEKLVPQQGGRAATARLPEHLTLAVSQWFAQNTGHGGCSDKDVAQLAAIFYGVTYEGGRESVDDALAVVEGFGPGIEGLNDTYARQVLLAQEVRRLHGEYMRSMGSHQITRNALRAALDHIEMDALRISHCKDAAAIDAARECQQAAPGEQLTPAQARAMVAEMDMNDAVLAGIDAEAAPQQEAQYNHGPQAETVEEAARDVGKWLNERPNRPLDLRHVAMLAHYATAPQQEAQEPVVAAVFDEQLGRPVIVEGAPLLSHGQPLYTAPQPAPAPLTDAAARALVWSSSDWIRSNSVNEDDAVELVRGAERVHGITQKGGA